MRRTNGSAVALALGCALLAWAALASPAAADSVSVSVTPTLLTLNATAPGGNTTLAFSASAGYAFDLEDANTTLTATLCGVTCSISNSSSFAYVLAAANTTSSASPAAAASSSGRRSLYTGSRRRYRHRHARMLQQADDAANTTSTTNTTTTLGNVVYANCPLPSKASVCPAILTSAYTNISSNATVLLSANVTIVTVQTSWLALQFTLGTNVTISDTTFTLLKLQVAGAVQTLLLNVSGTTNATVTPVSTNTTASSSGRRRLQQSSSSSPLLAVFSISASTSNELSFASGYSGLVDAINNNALALMPFLSSYGITGVKAKVYSGTTSLADVVTKATTDFSPSPPSPPGATTPSPPGPSPDSDDSSSSSKKALGIGLGVGLGGAALIAGVAALVVMMRRKQQNVNPGGEAAPLAATPQN